MIKFILTLFFILLLKKNIFATNIEEYLLKKAYEFNVRPVHLLYAIAKTESGLNPYALSVYSSDVNKIKMLLYYTPNIKKNCYKGKKKVICSFFHENLSEALYTLTIVKKLDLSYDIGLMQINHKNIKNVNPVFLYNPDVNVVFATYILNNCILKEKNLWLALECYNKGSSNKRIGEYTKKIYNNLLSFESSINNKNIAYKKE